MEKRLFGQRRYRRLIALTSEVRGDLERFYGVPARDVDVLPNGYDSTEFHVGLRNRFRTVVRKRLGISEDVWLVLFVGNEWERKGLLPLMEAIRRQEKSVHILAAGRLPKDWLMSQAASIGVRERVHFVGSSSPVNEWFGAADMFALPSSYEAWGMVVVEALASGLPALVSSVTGAAVAVREGANGLLLKDAQDPFAISEGIAKVRNGLRFTPGETSASVTQFEWNRVLARYETILRGCA